MTLHCSRARSEWKSVHLGEIAEVVGGKAAPQIPEAFDNEGIPFVRMKDLGRYHLTPDLVQVDDRINPEYAAKNGLKPLKAGAILMPRSGSVALNHRAILGVDAIIVSHICALVPNTCEISNRFLYYYLCTVTLERITKKTTGLDAINFSDLRELPIPLPPLSEQERLADILDKADGIRRKQEQGVEEANELIRSVFLERFGDPLTNRRGLPKARIRDFGTVVTGNTPSRNNPDNFGSAIEWIKSDNINSPNHFLTSAEEYLSVAGQSLGRTAPANSTLVTCIAGSPSVIGNAALADREVAFNQQINAVIPNRTTDPYFLYCQFLVGKKLIQENSTNSMKGMVSKGKFQEIEFLKPSQGEQKEFGEFFKRVIGMTRRLQKACSESEELLGSLSTRAFREEL
jgi:type I restriction enzyme S subunit